MACASCGADNPPANRFCGHCGAGLSHRCPTCRTANPPAARSCHGCGRTPAAGPGATPADAGELPARHPAADLSGAAERRLVTILFADLVGFTALSERLDAEEVREITTDCFRRLVGAVARLEGTVDKFMGDAIMVLFGAPIAHEDDPTRALLAALAMGRELTAFNRDLARTRGLTLALRTGVATGEVVVGLRDVGGVREYTAIGDAVNVAARLQAAAEPDGILVDETTARRAGQGFDLRPVAPLALKGKERPVAAYVVTGQRALGSSAAPRRAPLVGRDDELRRLDAAVDELRQGRGGIVAIIADPGLGKSRLLLELRSRVTERPAPPPPRWVRCQAFAHERGLSLGVARELVRAATGIDPQAAEAEQVARLRSALEALDCLDHYAALARLLGLGPSAPELAALAPQDLQRRTFAAVASAVEALARAGPLVLELDDLHWADPSSIDLLIEVMAVAEREAVLLCLAFRPDRDAPSWTLRERAADAFRDVYRELVLQPLSDGACAELAARLLRLGEVPPALSGVLERAAGTPLWIEELVRTLVERDLVIHDGDAWRVAAELDRVEIPTTLQSLIVARIDRLGAARSVLQTASVIGRRFGQRVLERVAEDRRRLRDHLVAAQRADLVRELQTVPEPEYGFKHVLTQEAAYATLLVRRRRELHRRVAEAIAGLYPDRLDELHAVLAHHYVQAEAWAEALRHARAAGEAARATYANREAAEHFERAAWLAERAGAPPGEQLALREAEAQARELLGDFERARAAYEAALELAARAGDAPGEARLLGALGMLWGGHRDYQRGLDLTRRAVDAARRSGDRCSVAAASVRVGVLLFNLARVAESARELEGALAVYRDAGDARGQAEALDVLTMATLCAGRLEECEAYGLEAIERLEALGERATAATTSVMLGQGLGYLGDRDAAVAWIGRGIDAYRELGARGGEAFGHMALAQALEPYGDFERAYRAATAGLAIAREIGHREWVAANLAFAGRIHRRCGDVATALELHREMLATARDLGSAIWTAYALGELAQDLAVSEDEGVVAPLLAEAVATGGDALLFIAPALLARCELLLHWGRPADALAAARSFRATARSFRPFAADALRVEGEALARLGQVGAAEEALRRARDRAAALVADPPLWRACLALAELHAGAGRPDEAAAQRAAAAARLEAVAASLTDGTLAAGFRRTEPMRRARPEARRA